MFGRLGIRNIANMFPQSPQGHNLFVNSLVNRYGKDYDWALYKSNQG